MVSSPSSVRKVSVRCLGISMFLMAVLWVMFVAGTKLHEMLVGAACVALSGLFLYSLQRSETLDVQFRTVDIAAAWRIPWYILSGVYEITIVLLQDMLSIRRASSFYRVGGFKTSKHDPHLIARRVLATAYTTTAPNFIVIGIDYEQSRMLFHQIERSSVPKMTKALGAQP
jgi:hypothetical protein